MELVDNLPAKTLPIVLASKSPRRRELLQGVGVDFTVLTPSEDSEPSLASTKAAPGQVTLEPVHQFQAIDKAQSSPWEHRAEIGQMVEASARAKAKSVVGLVVQPSLIIGADTVVHLGGSVLGKPRDEAEAFAMLRFLSGRVHEVITGICVYNTQTQQCVSSYVVTSVKFRELSEEIIVDYVMTREPMDKAGAYGIQGWGGLLIAGIEGSYFNVVGLPVTELQDLLLEQHYDILKNAAQRAVR